MSDVPVPVGLTSRDDKLMIEWNDGVTLEYESAVLRARCPCATCRHKQEEPKTDLRILAIDEAVPIKITGMRPLGNYAYGIAFSDGHATGIYSLELLRDLGRVVSS